MYISKLPKDLGDLCCKFAFDATMAETCESIDLIIELKGHDLHPMILSAFVGDYSLCGDKWHYCRSTHSVSAMGPYCPLRRIVPPPFNEVHTIWFAYNELFNYYTIQQVLFDIDWRRARRIVSVAGYRGRDAFAKWVCGTMDGLVFCSHFFKMITRDLLKKYPTETSRFIALTNYHTHHMINSV